MTTTKPTESTAATEAAAIAAIARDNTLHLLDASGIYLDASGNLVDIRRDLEDRRLAPDAKRGRFVFGDVASFVSYVRTHVDLDSTAVYVAPDIDTDRVAVAVLDDHVANDPDGAGWGRWTAELRLRHHPAWHAWRMADGNLVDQVAFAELLEDRLIDIVDPDGATLLEVASTITASTSVSFLSAQRLADGNRKFTWREDTEARAGASGELEIPERFGIAVPVWEHSDPVALTARLRYRIGPNGLRIGLKLDRPDDAVREARLGIVNDLRDQLSEVAVYVGIPASAHDRGLG